MIKCIAIDDEPIALKKIVSYIEKIPFLQLVAACDNTREALQAMTSSPVDALFIDINMPDMTGMEFLQTLSKMPLVVFTTAYSEYAVESYRYSAVDYLLKPYGFVDFQHAANKLLQQYNLSNGKTAEKDSLFVREEYKYVRVAINEIRYIQAWSEYVKIFMDDLRNPITPYTNFAQIKEKLPESFIQVHRSYIVNMSKVIRIERGRIIMDENTVIPIGDNYKDSVQEYLNLYSVGKSDKKKK
jgi:two-component system LytT family response regulator